MLKKKKKQHCNTLFSKHSLQQDSTTCNTHVSARVASSKEALEASTVMSSRAQEAQMFLVIISYPHPLLESQTLISRIKANVGGSSGT